jgi:deoxyribose-phosphate aldolase
MNYTKEQIAAALDLAVLKPTATRHDVIDAAKLVQAEGIASICVAPCNVALARRWTRRVCAVIGFPHGNGTIETKLEEAHQAIRNSACELDVVINYGRFLEGETSYVACDLRTVIRRAHGSNVKVKAILETCYYTPQQITDACKLCVECGADWVKTSTGFGPGGATLGTVAVMLGIVDGQVGVKASGGIKTYADACAYLNLGCTRIGASKYWELLP